MAACGVVLLLMSEDYRRSVGPLRQRETESLRDARELRERVAGAQKAIAEIRAREMDLARLWDEIDRAQADLPPGAASVSFPAWVRDHFAHSGIGMPQVRLNAAQDEPNASGYERGFWSVALPIDVTGRNLPTLLVAVADMDEQNAFVRVLDFEIRPDPENPGVRLGVLNLATVLRK
jgi:hypothetical protein